MTGYSVGITDERDCIKYALICEYQEYSLIDHDAVLFGRRVHTIQRNVLPQSSV
jgi:hypothetical protein